jgi:uncharacterized protein involved in exopolysaccharide biosynthesis
VALRELVRVIRKRWMLMALLALAGIAGALSRAS